MYNEIHEFMTYNIAQPDLEREGLAFDCRGSFFASALLSFFRKKAFGTLDCRADNSGFIQFTT